MKRIVGLIGVLGMLALSATAVAADEVQVPASGAIISFMEGHGVSEQMLATSWSDRTPSERRAVGAFMSEDVQDEFKALVFAELAAVVDGDEVTAAWMVVGTQKFGRGDLN